MKARSLPDLKKHWTNWSVRMAMTPEGKVKAAVKKWMKGRCLWSFWPVSNGMGVHGIPDAVLCVPVTITPDMVGRKVGLFVGVETKAPGKRRNLSDLQKVQKERIQLNSGIYVVVDDVGQLDSELPFVAQGERDAHQS